MPRSSLKPETETGFRTVQKIVPVDIVLAAGITDGEGKKSNRVMMRAQGGKQWYFLFPKGTEESMRPASPWLQDLLEKEVIDTRAPIPEDPITDVPSNPLED
jgi:hypothetical protein